MNQQFWGFLRGLLLAWLVSVALFQVWAPFYPLVLALGALLTCRPGANWVARLAGCLGLTAVDLIFFHHPARLNDTPFIDPVTTPGLATLWRGMELDPMVVLLSVGAGTLASAYLPRKWLVGGLLAFCCFSVFRLPSCFNPGFLQRSFLEPGDNQENDFRMYTKTLYLMQRNGGAYYPAFYEAYKIRFQGEIGANLIGFRPPVALWEMWLLAGSPSRAFFLHQLHIVVALLAVYAVTQKISRDSMASLLAPAFWLCYSANNLVTPWWINSEHWVLYWIPVVWWLELRGNHRLAMIGLLLSACARELFGILFLAPIVLAMARHRWRLALTWVATGALALALLLLHFWAVKSMFQSGSEVSGVTHRLQGGWWFVESCLIFNWNFLPRIFFLQSVLGLLALGALTRNFRKPEVWFLACQVLPMVLFFVVGYDLAFAYGVPFAPWVPLLSAIALADQEFSSPSPIPQDAS